MTGEKLKGEKERPVAPPSSSSGSSEEDFTVESNDDVSTDSDFYELSGGDTNSDSYEEALVQENTLLVQITETSVRVTFLKEDGTMIPVQMEAKFYSTPFWMALIKKKAFIFGSSVLPYAKRAKTNVFFKKTFWSWDIGKLLLDNFSSRDSRPFVVNDTIYNSTELLASLFFAHLKSETEKLLMLDKEIKSIVFCVPLWYGSLHRQRLLDSGKIAGFLQTSVQNTITVITYCHLLSKNLIPGTFTNFLVLSESSGNVDLVLYQSKSGEYIKMVACTGNLYTSARNSMRNLIKEHYESFKGNNGSKSNREKARKYLLRSLLLELQHKMPKEIAAVPLDVLTFCDTEQWESILEKEVGHIVTTYNHIGAPPIAVSDVSVPSGCTWSPPIFELLTFRGNKVTELSPFSVCRSDVIFGKWSVKLMEQDAEMYNSREIQSVTIYPTTNTTVYQSNVFHQVMPVGTLEITRALYYKYMKMEIQLTIGKEGRIKFQSIHACRENGQLERVLQNKEEYRWTPVNLTKLEVEKLAKDLQDIIESVKKLQNDFETKRESLWALCQEMAERIWFDKCKKKLGSARKKFLNDRIDKILGIIRVSYHPLMDFEIVELEKWIKEMKEYYTKYFT